MTEQYKNALQQAKNSLSTATYLSECGANAGLRKIFSNKASWLSRVVYLASKQLEVETNGNG